MASIPFSCTVIHKKNPFIESHPPIPSLIKICDYLAWQKYPMSRLSLCPITYPLPMLYNELSLDKSTGWRDLSRDLAKAAHTAGNSIMLNGLQKSNKDMNHNHVVRCTSFHGSTRTTAMELTDEYKYGSTPLLNKISTVQSVSRRLTEVEDAHASFSSWLNGAYMVSILTCNKRRAILIIHHIPKFWILAPFHSQHICSNKFVNIIKIAYLQRKEKGHLLSTKDGIDHVMENFELSKDISFVSLSDIPMREFFNSVESSSPKSTTNQDNAHQTPTNV
jgi:hypothetical protein